jgi:hypothetical protein
MMLTPRHIAGAESVEIEKATAPPSAGWPVDERFDTIVKLLVK